MSSHEQFFYGEHDPRPNIPSHLGREAGEFIDTSRWVTVSLVSDDSEIFVPGAKDSPHVSPDYAKESQNFRGDFKT